MYKGFSQNKFDVAVHMAGTLGKCTLQQAVDINIAGTRRFVQAALDAGCKKIVVASSVATMGTQAPMYPPKKLPLAADAQFQGAPWPYAYSKDAVEQLIDFMSKEEGNEDVDFIIVRIGNVVEVSPEVRHFDGLDDDGKPISWPVEPARKASKPFTKDSPQPFPEAELCSIALSDQVDCLKAAVKADHKSGVRTVACVAPTAYAVHSVPDIIRSMYGDEAASKIDMSHYSKRGRERDPLYDLSAAKKELGWEPKVDLLDYAPKHCFDGSC